MVAGIGLPEGRHQSCLGGFGGLSLWRWGRRGPSHYWSWWRYCRCFQRRCVRGQVCNLGWGFEYHTVGQLLHGHLLCFGQISLVTCIQSLHAPFRHFLEGLYLQIHQNAISDVKSSADRHHLHIQKKFTPLQAFQEFKSHLHAFHQYPFSDGSH